MSDFSSSRFSIARKRSMKNKREVAKALNVAEHTVHRWEGGLVPPTEENVERIASLFQYPTSFFYGDTIDEVKEASFRSYTSMSAALRDAALSAGSIGFVISDWAAKTYRLPSMQVPDLGELEPIEAAAALRREWRLGEQPIKNMVHQLEEKGVRVFALSEDTRKVNAYSVWRKETPFVFLNTYKSAESSRFDAAHELGHLVLHHDSMHRNGSSRKDEEDANIFAASFLMPKNDVEAHINRVRSLEQLIAAKQRWRVSLSALVRRVYNIGMISEWTYTQYCKRMQINGWLKNEPSPIERERSVVWRKVLEHMWRQRTSLRSVCDELALPTHEVEALLFHLLPTVEPPNQSAGLHVVSK